MGIPKIKQEQFAKAFVHIEHRAKPCTEWVKCECGKGMRAKNDIWCILCDQEDNRRLAGLPPKTTCEPSLDYFLNQQSAKPI